MPSLRELQRNFSAAIMFDDRAAMASLGIVAGGLDPARRIAIYRNNVMGNYRRALATTYPVVRSLVGVPFFATACDIYARGHASARGDVNRYGGDFATFLRTYAPARDLKYLSDVARLEWAVDQSNIAADAAPLDIAGLGAVPAEQVSNLRFHLAPSVRLLASPFPILHIWRVNQPGYAGDDRVDLGEGGDALLVQRTAGEVVIERIERGDHVLLAAVAAHAILGAAATRAAGADPAFDLAAALRRYVANETIVGFRPFLSSGFEDLP
jgi:hypothetical protein